MTYPTIKSLLEAYDPVIPIDQLPSHIQHWMEVNAPRQLEYMQDNDVALLFRGMVGPDKAPAIMDERRSYRNSKDAGNLYKMILSAVNPDWPSRDYATICTTDFEVAGSYGREYIIVPADDQIVAVSHYSDVAEQNASQIADEEMIAMTRAIITALCEYNPIESQEIAGRIFSALDKFTQAIHSVEPRDPDGSFTRINVAAAAIAKAVMHEARLDPMAKAVIIETLETEEDRPSWVWLLKSLKSGRVSPYIKALMKHEAFNFTNHAVKMKAADLLATGFGSSQEVWFVGPYVMFPA